MFELKPIFDEMKDLYPIEYGNMIAWHFRNVGSQPDNRKRYKLAWEPIFYFYGLEANELNFTETRISGEKWKADEQWDVWVHTLSLIHI